MICAHKVLRQVDGKVLGEIFEEESDSASRKLVFMKHAGARVRGNIMKKYVALFSTLYHFLTYSTKKLKRARMYARYLLGSTFVLFFPGYTFIKALFQEKELDNIERTAISLGMSIALVPIFVLILNYTPWGIRTTPVTLSLLALTTIFATAAIVREHQNKTKQHKTTHPKHK